MHPWKLFSSWLLLLTSTLGQNPCDPNPCGENTRCLVQAGAQENAVISCQCLPGFTQSPDGAFEGCVGAGAISESDLDPISDDDTSTTTSTTSSTITTLTTTETTSTSETSSPTTTDRPHLFPTSKTVIGFDSDGTEVKFHAANVVTETSDIISGGVEDLNPIQLSQDTPVVERKPSAPIETQVVERKPSAPIEAQGETGSDLPPHIENLDKDSIFNEECLVSEDCALSDFCDVTIRKCTSACSSDVCGTGAECKGRLHRPVCFCPKGYEGNPQQKCEKAKSRAGTKFRRRR